MRLLSILLVAFLLCNAVGCGKLRSFMDNREASSPIDSISNDSNKKCSNYDSAARVVQWAAAQADSTIAAMTLEQKAAQLLLPAIYAKSDAATMHQLREYADLGVGGIILLRGEMESAKTISDSLRAWSRIPPFIAIDAEFGLAMRLKGAPSFPLNADIPGDTDPSVMHDYGGEVARECRLLGINMVLGPVLDVAARNSVMGLRSLGTDPQRVAALAVAYAQGIEEGGVMSVAKHFPGHGAAEGDSHKKQPVIELSLHSLDSVHLLPFRRYIDAGLSAVMVGHLAFPAIDPKSLPAAVSPTVITDLLRNDMGFKGIIMTDALNMKGARGMGADRAVLAGADLITAPADTRKAISDIVRGIKQKQYPESTILASARRVLTKKYLIEYNRNTLRHHSPQQNNSITSPETISIKHRLDKD